MNSNKNIHKRPILISAVAAVCILVASSSGNAASTGGIPTQQENAVLTNTLRGDSTSTNTQRNTMSSKSGSTWRGAARAEWTQRWWRWWMSIPLGVGPSKDTTGVQCGINQSGPVWFIGGPLGSDFVRSCTIPQGKAILSPIVDFINDYPCPAPPAFEPAPDQTLEDFLIAGVTPIIDSVTVHAAELDGRPLRELRITSSLFSFTGAIDLVSLDPCVTGSPQVGVSDGYFIFIDPLSVGQHTLHIHSELPGFGLPNNGSSEGTYILNITK